MFGLLALMVAGAAVQDGQGTQATPAPAEKKICRAIVDTGSRLGRRKICRTRAEWSAADAEAQRDAADARSRSRSN